MRVVEALQVVLVVLSYHGFVDGSDVMRIRKDNEHSLRRGNNDHDGIVRSRDNGNDNGGRGVLESGEQHDGHRTASRLRKRLRNLIDADANDTIKRTVSSPEYDISHDRSIVSDVAVGNQQQQLQQRREVAELHSESLEEELEEGYERHDDPPEERDVPGDEVFLRTTSTTSNNIFAKRAGRYDQIERKKKKIASSQQKVRKRGIGVGSRQMLAFDSGN